MQAPTQPAAPRRARPPSTPPNPARPAAPPGLRRHGRRRRRVPGQPLLPRLRPPHVGRQRRLRVPQIRRRPGDAKPGLFIVPRRRRALAAARRGRAAAAAGGSFVGAAAGPLAAAGPVAGAAAAGGLRAAIGKRHPGWVVRAGGGGAAAACLGPAPHAGSGCAWRPLYDRPPRQPLAPLARPPAGPGRQRPPVQPGHVLLPGERQGSGGRAPAGPS
jgi:hypothetical protein